MADSSLIDKLFTRQEILEAELRWNEFFKTEMSSIYQDRDIHSGNYSVLIRSFAKYIAGLDLLYDKYTANVILEEAMYEALYTNFGFLLESKDPSFSFQEYRVFLINLLDLLFKGFTIANSRINFLKSLQYATLSIGLIKAKPNTSLNSKGLTHVSSKLTTTGPFAFLLDHEHELSHFHSSKDLNDIFVQVLVTSDSRFYMRELEILFNIVRLVASAIAQPIIRVVIDDSPIVTAVPQTISSCIYQSLDNFKTVSTAICFDEDGTPQVSVETAYINAGDEYDYLKVTESVSYVASYEMVVNDSVHVVQVDESFPAQVSEEVFINGLCLPQEEGLFYGGPETFGGVYYDPRCLLTVPPYCDTGTELLMYDHQAFYNDDGENRYGQPYRPSECEDPDNHYELEILPIYTDDTQTYPWLNGNSYQVTYGNFSYGVGITVSSENNTTLYPDCKVIYNRVHLFENPLNADSDICYYAKVYDPNLIINNTDVGGAENYDGELVQPPIIGQFTIG